MPAPIRHVLILLTAMTASLLACSAPAAAATGDYTVRLTSTSGGHWYLHGRGPFVATAMRVYSGIGNFGNGDYRAWRVNVPGEGSRIVGGRIATTMATPHTNMRGRILVGTGGTPAVLYDGGADGVVERTISGAHDWAQFDLRAIGPASTSRIAENSITATSIELVLRDSVSPVAQPTTLPSPTAWHSAGSCIPVAIRLTDQGGGLRSATIHRATSGSVVTSWNAALVESTRPGPILGEIGDCIEPSERNHGDTEYVAMVHDVGGNTRQLNFWLRADHVHPVIGGGPGSGARFTSPDVPLSFSVEDSGAGVASVQASLDGASVPVAVDGRTARLEVGRLALGEHVVALVAVDGAGNRSSVEQRFTVVDVTPPKLELDSPGARGDATLWLSVRASDDASGVDPTSWVVSVNGEPVTIHADERHATATIGPLSPGMQRIDVRVADRAGNAATLAHAYDVASAAVPSMPAVGARSGAWIVEGPTTPIGFGRPAGVAVYVARNGRPMPGQLVEVRRHGATLATATTESDGIARLSFAAGLPGGYAAHVVGLALEPAPIPLRVAPRLLLGAMPARPRVGRRVRLAGRMVPAIRGRRVAVEARIGGAWYPIGRSAAVGADGRFASHVTATRRGSVWVRVRVLAVGAWAPATSNERQMRVR